MATTYQLEQTLTQSIQTQGDTGTPSVVRILAKESGIALSQEFAVRVLVANQDGWADATNATIAPTSGYGTTVTTHSATKDLTIRTQPAVAATETLTISGVVIDGETITINGRVYEFDTDSSTTGDVDIDISASATASQGTLTMDTQPTLGDSTTIGTRTYVWVANGAANFPGEISIGADLAAAKVNFVAAINGTDGVNTASTFVTAAAFVADACVLTALTPGTAGDAIATTETFTAGTNVFDAAVLGTTTAGVDCTAANAVTAVVAAITGDGSAVVSAADGVGDTVDITAVTAGTAANAYTLANTMANGSWGAATMSGGLDELKGEIRVTLTDASAETVTVRLGAPSYGGLVIDYSENTLDVTHAAP